MSVARKAARGALWTIVTSIGGRAVGVLGTLVMTRFLAPDIVGEVSVAMIVCYSISWMTTWGFGQYAVVKGRGDDALEVTWHATLAYISLGVLSLGALGLFGDPLMSLLRSPEAAAYIPGGALAVFIRRVGAIPERVLSRSMRFRAIGLANFSGELSYTACALVLASRGYGGMSVIYANIVQSTVYVGMTIAASGWREWATPTKLSLARIKDMLRFGLPLSVQLIAHGASRYWDNITVAACFGADATGTYNMAYNLADIPAIQIGEQIALVLLPSMAELPPDKRPRAVERSSALLSLILFPLAVGLGLVAGPLIALVLPADKWQEVGPLLVVLTSLSVFRPIVFVLSAFMEANQRTTRLMVLEVAKLVLLVGGIVALYKLGLSLGLDTWDGLRLAACAVGISFGGTAIAAALIVSREGPSLRALLVGFLQPLAACAVMAAAVFAIERALDAAGLHHPGIHLAADIVTGAIAYVAAALVVARTTSRDLLSLLKKTLKRGE